MKSERGQHSGRDQPASSPAGAPSLRPLDWAAEAGAADDVWQQTNLKVRRRRRRLGAAVGSLLALCLVAVGAWHWSDRGRGAELAARSETPAFRAQVLMPRMQHLPDGSTIEFKQDAQVQVAFDDRWRRVVLVQGEAHFQVAKDTERPFVVQVGSVEVRAVGTAFSVQLARGQVEVLVSEGTVAVEAAAAQAENVPVIQAEQPRESLAIVEAGRRLVVDPMPISAPRVPLEVVAVPPSELETRLSWRAPRVEFSRTPLSEALPLINQYSRVQVHLGDPALAQVRLSGILRADNIDTLLRLLEEEHGLVAQPRGVNEVVLTKR